MQYHASIVCAQWQDGPTYDYGMVLADDLAEFSAKLTAHFAECDRQRRGIAYVRLFIGDRDEERLTRDQVAALYLPRREDCPWCDGQGYAYHDSDDGVQYGMGFPCQRCNANGWIEVTPDEAAFDLAMSELEVDHPEAFREAGDEYDDWGGTNRRYE